jgi:hypothetical protein
MVDWGKLAKDPVGYTAESGVGAVSDMWNSATGGNTREQANNQAAADAARAKGEQARSALASQSRDLQIQGYDPPGITQHDNWEAWDHQRLSQFRETLKTDDLGPKGDATRQLGERITQIFADLHGGATKAAEGMQGKGAEAAIEAARPLQEWGKSFGDAVRGTGLKIQEISATAEQTKASIPPPSEGSTTRNILSGIAPGGQVVDGALQMKERQEDEKRARAVAQNVYTPGYQSVDKSTPTLPPPVDPVNPPPPPPKPGGGTGDNPGISGTGDKPKTGAGSAPPGGSSVDSPGKSGSAGSGPGAPAGSGSAWAPSQPPIGQVPPGAGPNPPGGAGGQMPPGMVGMPGGAGGAGGGAGGAKAGGAGGRAGAPGGGAGAGGRAGVGGGAAAGGAGAGGGAGARGGAAGAGAGAPGGAAGQRGQGEGEDNEHETPSWLQESDDIWLNDMPKTAPAVFGDWGNE